MVCLCAFVSHAESSGNAYLSELLKKAEQKQLYRERYWDVLLHYKKTFSGIKSLIDDPRFFLSPDGKKDPKAELAATISGFFEEETEGAEHPQCRFIARYSWLKKELMIDEAKLPHVECKAFKEALNLINPKSAVLIFPTAHMNDPASMFGHTLIRIDSAYRSKLLSYAVNYSANTGGASNTFTYALKGVFGFYRGFYSILPYYEKVNEYNNIDQRDMWEYGLNLSEKEVLRMVMHIWELKEIYSYYYFFDENCSYNLLFLFEAARPSVNLTDQFGFWVIPIDTVRAVEKSGLVETTTYRPSMATKIRHIASLLDRDSKDAALNVANREMDPENIPVDDKGEKVKILDLDAEMIQYKFAKKKLTKDEYLKQFLAVLNARTVLGKADDESYNIPDPPKPEEGHRSARLSVGLGLKNNSILHDTVFQEIKLRPAYHDLLDNDKGYVEGSQIVFADIAARYYFEDNKFKLQSLDLIDIVSLYPLDEFFKSFSWKISTGFEQELLAHGKEHLIYRVNPGGGIALKNKILGLCYLLFEGDLNVSDKFVHYYAFGVGPSAGVIKTVNEFWKASLTGKALFYELGDKHQSYKVTLAQNFALSANNSLQIHLSGEKTFHTYQTEIKCNWNIYF
jgi:uncharacterized protein DUF4105